MQVGGFLGRVRLQPGKKVRRATEAQLALERQRTGIRVARGPETLDGLLVAFLGLEDVAEVLVDVGVARLDEQGPAVAGNRVIRPGQVAQAIAEKQVGGGRARRQPGCSSQELERIGGPTQVVEQVAEAHQAAHMAGIELQRCPIDLLRCLELAAGVERIAQVYPGLDAAGIERNGGPEMGLSRLRASQHDEHRAQVAAGRRRLRRKPRHPFEQRCTLRHPAGLGADQREQVQRVYIGIVMPEQFDASGFRLSHTTARQVRPGGFECVCGCRHGYVQIDRNSSGVAARTLTTVPWKRRVMPESGWLPSIVMESASMTVMR